MTSESDLQIQVADYLRLQYPDVLFHSDFGSGVKLTPGQAVKQKRQNGGRRAWPDMFVVEPRTLPCVFRKNCKPYPIPKISKDFVSEYCDGLQAYYGLFLELKKEGVTLHSGPRAKRRFKSRDDREYKTAHLMEQANCLYDLRQRGYCAEFAIGFEEAKKIIDEYLGGR